MRRFFGSRPFKAFVCVIVAVLLGAVIAAFTHNNSTPLSSAASTVLHPLQRISSYLSYKFSNFSDRFQSSSVLKEENEALREQVSDYQQQVIDYNEIKNKLETYEDFLGVKEENPDFIFANATVIARDSSNISESFTLNKGSLNDIEINDPVISGTNLVGVVTGVAPTTCTVSTIANPDVNVGIYETYTNEVGYSTGTGSSKDRIYCKIPGLKSNSVISPNGIICTTGNGGIYPKNLVLGTVVSLEDSEDGVSSFATVRSAVDISELSEVFIITSFDGQGVVSPAGE